MLIIPAIDIRSARVVRLWQGDFSKETFYSDSPAETAKRWESQGAKLLHLVDLDGALAGEPKNLDAIEEIKKAVSIPIEVGGGLRTEDAVDELLSKGVSRAIIGTRAYTDDEFVKMLLKNHKDKIAVGIDCAGKNLVVSGWTSSTSIDAVDFAKHVEQLGVETIIYTDVLKDGTMEGLRLESVKEMLAAVKIRVIISGGIASLQDIRDLKGLNSPNLYGVITGRALYEKRLDLKEASRIAEGG